MGEGYSMTTGQKLSLESSVSNVSALQHLLNIKHNVCPPGTGGYVNTLATFDAEVYGETYDAGILDSEYTSEIITSTFISTNLEEAFNGNNPGVNFITKECDVN